MSIRTTLKQRPSGAQHDAYINLMATFSQIITATCFLFDLVDGVFTAKCTLISTATLSRTALHLTRVRSENSHAADADGTRSSAKGMKTADSDYATGCCVMDDRRLARFPQTKAPY